MIASPGLHCPGPPPSDFRRPIASCVGGVSLARANGDLMTEAVWILGGAVIGLVLVTGVWLWITRVHATDLPLLTDRHGDP